MSMYLLAYDYEDTSRDEDFTEEERDIANQRYRDLRDDPYANHFEFLVMCIGISFNNCPDAKVYTYRTEHYHHIGDVLKPVDKNGKPWIDEYGDCISVYVRTSGYRSSAYVKDLAKSLGRKDLDVLYVKEEDAAAEVG